MSPPASATKEKQGDKAIPDHSQPNQRVSDLARLFNQAFQSSDSVPAEAKDVAHDGARVDGVEGEQGAEDAESVSGEDERQRRAREEQEWIEGIIAQDNGEGRWDPEVVRWSGRKLVHTLDEGHLL